VGSWKKVFNFTDNNSYQLINNSLGENNKKADQKKLSPVEMNTKQKAKQLTSNLPKLASTAFNHPQNYLSSKEKNTKTLFRFIPKFYICEIHKILKSFKRGQKLSLVLSTIQFLQVLGLLLSPKMLQTLADSFSNHTDAIKTAG